MEDKSQRTTIAFDVSKRELFTPQNGFKSLHKKLRSNWKITRYIKTPHGQERGEINSFVLNFQSRLKGFGYFFKMSIDLHLIYRV